ncbi:hypothetical protein L218DRAFT_1076414 [Marasmius fiardii PR-910]|nr:hypothetical protein L218DRAFT_1076414 [Marasmius fiardii PR-910]
MHPPPSHIDSPQKTPFLPLELIIHILRHLQNAKATLCCTSLVCHAWLPIARSVLFRHVHIHLSGLECHQLFDLWETHLETFSLSRVQKLCIDSRNNNAAVPPTPRLLDLDELLKWQSSDGKRTLTGIMNHVKDLRLHGLRWWTLDSHAKLAMVQGFRSVTKLHLSRVLFDVFDTPNSNANDDFVSLLNSFPELEALEVESIHLPVNNSQGEHRRISKKLRTLSLKDVGGNARVMQLLLPCPNVEILSFTSAQRRCWESLTPEWAITMADIMNSCGESLKEFRLTLAPGRINSEALPATDGFLELVNASTLRNLERIHLDTDDSSFVFSFVYRLVKSYGSEELTEPSLVSFSIPSMTSFLEGAGASETETDYSYHLLDQLLQHPVFCKLQEIKFDVPCQCYPDGRGRGTGLTFEVEMQGSGVTPFSGSPVDVGMQKKMENIRSVLPLCYDRGILKAEPAFRCVIKLPWRPSY